MATPPPPPAIAAATAGPITTVLNDTDVASTRPLSPLPPTYQIIIGPGFQSFQKLMTTFNKWTFDTGLGFRYIQSTNKSKKTGQYTRWIVYCDRRGPNRRPSITMIRK